MSEHKEDDFDRGPTAVPLHSASFEGSTRQEFAMGMQFRRVDRTMQAFWESCEYEGQCRRKSQPSFRGICKYLLPALHRDCMHVSLKTNGR